MKPDQDVDLLLHKIDEVVATQRRRRSPLFERAMVHRALVDTVLKLDPRVQVRNPVMFVVYVGSILTTVLYLQALRGQGEAPAGFILAITLWLWFTVLFANFAEAVAEGRGKAQAAALKGARRDVMAKKLTGAYGDGNYHGPPTTRNCRRPTCAKAMSS